MKNLEKVQQISKASIEQNAGADQVNNALQGLNDIIQQNATESEQLASSADELNRQSIQLRKAISFFKVGSSNKITNTSDKHFDVSSVHFRDNQFSSQNSSGKVDDKYESEPVYLDRFDGLDEEYEKF